jgi:NAD(P)-dependent dehydrogenase (short-subunit alcohol dehydrogenase family)
MNQIALVTGSSRGLGKSMALHLADHGVDVVVTYQTKEKEAREVVSQIETKGRKAVALQLDVADSRSYGAFAERLQGELSRVWRREQFDRLVNVHLKATFFLTQKLLPLLADGGRVVNVSSGLARFTFPGASAYAAMKGGIEVLTRYMAKELGPRGIAVNTIAPGAIETDFNGGMVRDNKQLNAGIAAQTALGRVGLPDDVGGAVAMLLAPESGWINGQRIEVSGGMLV